MNSSKSKEIKVGAVTLLAIILFIVGISIGNNLNVRVDYKRIHIRFPNSAGIEKTSPVFVNGVKRGTVISVNPDNGSVLIAVDIDNINDFRQDVTARIGILEITGGKKIDINPGTSDLKFTQDIEIKGSTSPDIGEMVAMLGDMGADAKKLLIKLDTLATTANNLLNDKRIDNTLASTAELTQTINSFINSNIKSLELIVSNLKSLTDELKNAVNKYEPKIDNITSKIDFTLDETQKLMKSAEDAISNANNMINDLKEISDDIKVKGGLAGKLIYDKEFALKLDSTLQSLNLFILQIKEHGINVNTRLGTRP